MAQRNPMNERYNPDLDHGGKTKKSAASAKPKRKASEGVRVQFSSANKTKEQKRKEASERRKEDRSRIYASGGPQDPVYKKWRKVWWTLMILTALCTGAYVVLAPRGGTLATAGTVTLVLAYIMLAAAVFIEFKFCRPIRKQFERQMNNMTVAQKRRYDAKIAEERAQKKAEKAARGGLFGGNKKKADAVAKEIEEEEEQASKK